MLAADQPLHQPPPLSPYTIMDYNEEHSMVTFDDDHVGDFSDEEKAFMERIFRNECIRLDELEKTVMNRLEFQVVMGVLYSLIWIFGITSNCLILYVVLTESSRSRPWNANRRASSISACSSTVATSAFFSVRFVFVASLTCADLLTTLTSLPVTSIYFFTRHWPFPKFVCHVIGVFQGFSIFQSSFTFTSIAIDRYLLIFYPNRNVMTKTRAAVGLTALAALSLVLATPTGVYTVVLENPEVIPGATLCGQFCIEEWPHAQDHPFWNQRVYGLSVLMLQFGLPITVTSWCYWRVACRLRQLRRNRRRSEVLSLSTEATRRQSCGGSSAFSAAGGSTVLLNGVVAQHPATAGRRQRTNRMMLAMVIAFILSWSPHNILNLIRDFGLIDQFPGSEHTQVFPFLYAIAHLIGMSTLVWNPLLYAWYNKSIRDSLKVFLFWRCRKQLS